MMDADFLFDSMPPSCCFYHILVHCSARDLPLSWSHLKNTPFDLLFLSRPQSSEKRGGERHTVGRQDGREEKKQIMNRREEEERQSLRR
jgi:hypothetical protein